MHRASLIEVTPNSLNIDRSSICKLSLVKKDSHFVWNKSPNDTFQHSKQVIVDLVQKGIATFEKDQMICLTPGTNSNYARM